MQRLLFLNLFAAAAFVLLLASCGPRPNERAGPAPVARDTVVAPRQANPERDSIWGRPVRAYLDNPRCAPLARDFYYGRFHPSDDARTDSLLQLASSPDADLRPFYRWCLEETIRGADGAVAELVGVPARRYAENYPRELFGFLDADLSGDRYRDWISAINYSGYYPGEDARQPNVVRSRLARSMSLHCGRCTSAERVRIEQFASDCFSNGPAEGRQGFSQGAAAAGRPGDTESLSQPFRSSRSRS